MFLRGRRSWRKLFLSFAFLLTVSCFAITFFREFWIWLLYETLHAELPCFATEKDLNKVQHMVKGFHDVMTRLNITYWIDYGILLGQYRYHDILPWDHDADFGYLLSDRQKLVANGIGSILLLRDWNITLPEYNPVSLRYQGAFSDVFVYGTYHDLHLNLPKSKNNETLTRGTYRNSQKFEETFSDSQISDILPTWDCAFSGLLVKCPAKRENVLDTRYRNVNWRRKKVPYKLQCYVKPWNLLRILLFY